MSNIDYLYDVYFNEFENKQANPIFKSEVYSSLNYIYEEIEYTKKFIRIKNKKGIEQDYENDMKIFKRDAEKFKQTFYYKSEFIREPKRISEIFTTQYNYLTHLGINEKIINEVFEIIREDTLNVKTSPSLKRQQTQLNKRLLDISVQENTKKFKLLRKENLDITFEELIKKFIQKS